MFLQHMRNIISEICELFACRYDMLQITGNPSLKDTYLYLQRHLPLLPLSTAGISTYQEILWGLSYATFTAAVYWVSKCIIQPRGMLPSSHCTFPSSPHRPLTWLPAVAQVQAWLLVQIDHTKMSPLGEVAIISRRNCQSRSTIILQGASSSTSRMDPSLWFVFCNNTLCQINWESSKISKASFRNILGCHH